MTRRRQAARTQAIPAARPWPVSLFSMVLGLSGFGYALLSAARLWPIPPLFGQSVLALTVLVWCALMLNLSWRYWRQPRALAAEFKDPAAGPMGSLVGIATLVLVPGTALYWRDAAGLLAGFGIAWHLGFSLWHGARLWRGGRDGGDTTPALYLPDVAGNFTSAAALGVLGHTDWAWLFLGAGVFSWLSLEPVIKGAIIHRAELAVARRPLMGIQAAPPVVCAASALLIEPHLGGPWIPMLLGYGLFQLLQGLRLLPWLARQRFARSYWAYTFGMTSALNCCLKLALAGNAAARLLAPPLMLAVGGFIVYLLARTAWPSLTSSTVRR